MGCGQVRLAAENSRVVLGDEDEDLAAAMRFSRRQRKMEVDQDLDADKAVELQEERAAQQRSALTADPLESCPHV